MRKYISLFFVTLAVVLFVNTNIARTEQYCTADAKLCPDGSFVGRTGPNCEFSACPNSTNRESPIKRESPSLPLLTERKAFTDDLKIRREAFLAELKIKREEFRLANAEKREEWRQKVKRMIGERFNAAVRNLERMQTRIENIIAKLDVDGKDIDTATDYLNSSKEKLNNAKVEIAKIEALIPTDSGKITPEIFEQIKLLARIAKDLLKESHHNLVQAIKEIKGLRKITN